MRRMAVVVVALAVTAGCGVAMEGPGGNACDHFSHVIDDINAGVLTEREIELKLWEVYDHVRGLDYDFRYEDVRNAAGELYVMRVNRSSDVWVSAVEEMNEACEDVHRELGG